MSRPDLQVAVLRVSPARIDGRVANDMAANAWIRADADVTVFLNPPHTGFRDAGVCGNGRIYEDRIEIDLVLVPERAAALLAALTEGATLQFQTESITESLFRIEAVTASR
ncbi:hypothetical protein WBP07_31485 [Novosphingobium sp. BL-8A]|uniref:hypothetical protein n=1 Tax=Novosphingobium sp. BL-8A TaxID=3127639 RepID=UPI003757F737